MTMNTVGRPSAIEAVEMEHAQTVSGDRGLDHEESLLFELGRKGMCGVDIPAVDISDKRLNGLRRKQSIGLPGLTAPTPNG